MKLRNKRTGDIWEFDGGFSMKATQETAEKAGAKSGSLTCFESSIAELNEEWEDYEEPKDFWFIDDEGDVEVGGEEYEENLDKMKSIGNYFETEEEAKKAVEKLKAWKRLKDNGFKFEGWKRDEYYCGDFTITATDQTSCDDKDLDLLFRGEE